MICLNVPAINSFNENKTNNESFQLVTPFINHPLTSHDSGNVLSFTPPVHKNNKQQNEFDESTNFLFVRAIPGYPH